LPVDQKLEVKEPVHPGAEHALGGKRDREQLLLLSDFWSDHPQADRLGSLLTIGHVNSDALGLC
jgi:hypothetical protein